ncbi:Hypothetical protein EMIHUDRAFT_220995 [Emiliania huxleyi CCMP1516]|uniref:RNase H type-1 domain-containing protein n=2 Tax=Emiliania huxleyi TaxID=2903 RepID=A0A0D3HZT4_EMIH1|nr:Hypothetical protein EMIHUDRAFT_220995 [Emiliania huxleyi CCMP1516]EOD04519.1 Hypothetical protein EMIHUDRAFT_220995 [Emiliania huxleyi CCMP1516]|eukprot:XP_005756948.1 Hypothetical protein EMIHUDRAFT_220995 [Emiliania huxleyi CCMP1516]
MLRRPIRGRCLLCLLWHEVTWRHVKGHSGHKWNDYVDKQADLGRSGARDCDAPEWQDESIPTDADDGESSTVGDDVARHIGDNKGIRRERAIDIDVDPADSTDVDVITSAATALSLDDTVENRTEDLAEAIGRITLDPDPAPTPRGGGTRPCRAPLAAPGRGTPWKRASSPVSRTPLAGAADQFRERSSAGVRAARGSYTRLRVRVAGHPACGMA